MKCFITLILLFTTPVVSYGFTLELNQGNNNSGVHNNATANMQAPFLAHDYFSPRFPGGYTEAHWPERVTLEVLDTTIEEFKELIVGKWKTLFTCSGRPLRAREIIKMDRRLLDGVYNPFVIMNFINENELERNFLSPLTVSPPVESFDRSSEVSFESLNSQDILARYSHFKDSTFSVIKIKETNERLIRFKQSTYEKCFTGEDFYMILVKIEHYIS